MKAIVMKEAKSRVRSWKNVGMISGYVLLLGITVALMLYTQIYDRGGLINFSNNFNSIFITITVVQVLMISFIVPIITAGSISLEREKQTLDILLSTNLRPISIIMGKLMTSISQVLLLIIASLPVFSFIFLFGGVSLGAILQILLFFVVISVFFGSIGVFFSVVFKKTLTSIVMTYLVMILLTIGTLVITYMYSVLTGSYSFFDKTTFWLLYFNPGLSFWAVLMKQFGEIGNFYELTGSNDHFALISMVIYIILSVGLVFLSAYMLNPVRKRGKR